MKPEQPTSPGVNPGRDAARAERKARRGPHHTKVSLDELLAMGHSVVDRVRPYVERGVGRLRARFHRE